MGQGGQINSFRGPHLCMPELDHTRNMPDCSTEHFTDLDKLKLQRVVWFKAHPIFATAPAASENDACFKSDQHWLKNNHHASLE